MQARIRRSLICAAVIFGALAHLPAALAVETGEMVDRTLTYPVDGPSTFSDDFWAGRTHGFHGAIDIFAEKGVPVLAAEDGLVKFVNFSSNPANPNPHRCCSIVIEHDDGWQTWYLHLDNDTPGTDDGQRWGIAEGITAGGRVEAGDLIGWVGDSGNAEATPPHLHFALHAPDDTEANPYQALVHAQTHAAEVPNLRALRHGDIGADVEALQSSLDALGLEVGPVDGIFGQLTAMAVESFQGDYRLDVDGVVGEQTRSALAELLSLSNRILRRGDRGLGVEHIQKLLLEAGFDPGPLDGVFGGLTFDAVQSFQADRGLSVDGLVGPQTHGALTMM